MQPGDLGMILLRCPVALGMEGHDCNGPDCNCGGTILDADAWAYLNLPGAADMSAQSDKKDAERWRALMSSQRIRVIGSAGMYSMEADLRMPADGYMHIGVEFWSLHRSTHPSTEFPQEQCREALTFYADQLRGKLAAEVKS